MCWTVRAVVAISVTALGSVAAPAQGQQGVKRTDLQRHDLSIAGRETVQARIDIAPGAEQPGIGILAKR
jgi:hypothetical protein